MAKPKRKIDPSCIYCQHGVPGLRMDIVFCLKKGIVGPYHSCPSFSPMEKPKDPPLPPSMQDGEIKDIFGVEKDVSLERIEVEDDKTFSQA